MVCGGTDGKRGGMLVMKKKRIVYTLTEIISPKKEWL